MKPSPKQHLEVCFLAVSGIRLPAWGYALTQHLASARATHKALIKH
jgi:hypothetical protein